MAFEMKTYILLPTGSNFESGISQHLDPNGPKISRKKMKKKKNVNRQNIDMKTNPS